LGELHYQIRGHHDFNCAKNRIRYHREGEAIFEAVNTPHNGKNLGEIPVRLVVFYIGEEGKPITVKVRQE
jgi:quercetin dioxygenase-like cupin family protein